jgi:hypothetical protein
MSNKNAIELTIDSIEQLVQVYKDENNDKEPTMYTLGYADALDTVLRNLAMYRKIVADKQAEAALSE